MRNEGWKDIHNKIKFDRALNSLDKEERCWKMMTDEKGDVCNISGDEGKIINEVAGWENPMK